MSRRRPTTPRHRPDHIRFDVECDGTVKHPHAVERIARITVKDRPDADDLEGAYIEVRYIRVDMDPEDNDYTMPNRDTEEPHMTRRFPCSRCSFDKPLQDLALVRLGRQLDALGHRRVRLREIP